MHFNERRDCYLNGSGTYLIEYRCNGAKAYSYDREWYDEFVILIEGYYCACSRCVKQLQRHCNFLYSYL